MVFIRGQESSDRRVAFLVLKVVEDCPEHRALSVRQLPLSPGYGVCESVKLTCILVVRLLISLMANDQHNRTVITRGTGTNILGHFQSNATCPSVWTGDQWHAVQKFHYASCFRINKLFTLKQTWYTSSHKQEDSSPSPIPKISQRKKKKWSNETSSTQLTSDPHINVRITWKERQKRKRGTLSKNQHVFSS